MACQINRTKDGKINSVTTPTGAKSKLFEAIHGNVFLADAETSVKIYNNAYSQKVEKMFEGSTANKYDTGEPQLFYKSPSNKVYDNLEEVLINEELGSISMGFKNPKNDEFIPIANFTNKGSEKNEFLTSKVREGLLSADRVLGEDGVTRFQGKGEYDTTRKVTGLFVATDLAAETGNGRVKVLDDGTIEMEFSNGYSEVIDNSGASKVIRTENIPEYLKQNPDTQNKVDLAIEYVIKFDNPQPLDKDNVKATTKTTNLKSLENSLVGFLKSLGFTTSSLDNYRKNYNTKHGEGRDISALADIANKVIAFRNGEISAEDLSEEVAHIAIESFADQGSITAALANVHLTPEYTELSDKYRKRYSEDELSKVELEDKVRKEILGKLLKKELMSRFSTQNRSENEVYLIRKLKEIWDYFMNMLRTNIKPYHMTLLEELNTRIADSILNQNSDDFIEDLLKDNTNYYYSLMDKGGKAIHDELERARADIEDMYNSHIKEPSPSLVALEDMSDTMSDYRAVSAINTVVGTASRQMNILKDATAKAVKEDVRLSTKDRHRYEVLKENLLPTVNNLIAELKNNKKGVTDKKLLSTIEILSKSASELASDMAEVEPAINNDKLAWVDRMLIRILNHTSLTDAQKEEIKKNLDGGFRDIGFLGKMFGLSSHSRNMALQLMHFSVMNITARTNRKFLSRMNELLTDISLKNGMKHQKAIIHKDADGNDTFYVLSPRDFAWEDKMIQDKKAEILANKTGKTVAEIEKELQSKLPQEIVKDDKLFQEYKDELGRFKQEQVRERRFNNEYYKERDARYDKANVSEETRDYLSKKNAAMNFRHKEGGHIKPDGTKDLSGQTELEKRQDLEDKQRHRQVASPYDTLGNIKPGLKRVKVSELTKEQRASIPVEISDSYTGDVTILDEGMTLEELSKNYPDSRRSLDIFNHNMLYRNELEKASKTSDPIQKFFEKIQDIESKGEVAYDWLVSNASLAISSDFYEGMADGKAKDDITQNYIDRIADQYERESAQIQFDYIKELKRSRSELLKQNKKSHSALEYDAKHMTDGVRAKVLELDTEISERTRALNIPFDEYDELGESIMQSDLNEDFYKMLTESGLSEYDFALKHSPVHNKDKVRTFARQIDDYINGRLSYLKPNYAKFVRQATEEGLLDDPNLSKGQIAQILKDAYAKENVATYFKRFQPKGYTEALNAMKDGIISISEVLNNKNQFLDKYPALEYIEFNPDYTWRQEVTNDDKLNPNFKSGDTFSQPKKLNDAFFSKYFLDVEKAKADYLALEDEDLSKLTPTKNKEEYEYLKTTVNINKEIVENYGDTGRINPYMRVQMKKSDMERALTIHKAKKGDIKDWLGDIVKSQIDEKEYGEQINNTGINIKKVPKYYQQRVENPNFLTQNTLQASLVSLKASIRYKERLLAEQDIKAIEYKISQQSFKSSGGNSVKARLQKKGEVSNYYAKAQEMADYHLYGIRQNRKMITTIFGKEVDFTQIFSRFTQYVRNVNLAYNPLVDITSYTTGVYNNLIDTIAGDYYHKSSVAQASSRLPKLMALYMSEEGGIKKTSELNHLLEWLNVFSEDERLNMSAYSRMTRIASNSFYLGAKIANLPVTPRNMLAILYDNKFHNGRFKSYNEFARDMRVENKSISSKEVTARWAKNTDTFYSNLKIDPNLGISMGENFKSKFGDKSEDEFDFYHEKLTAKITQVNQSVDSIVSNEDQTASQRDVLTNALMMHRSWFLINMTRKWKGKHFNLATGQYEAGHYNTAVGTIKKLIGNSLSKEDRKAYREIIEEHEIRNLIRAGIDGIGILLLVGLTNMLMADDDDDDSTLENLAQLIALRTTNETQSQHIIGSYGTIKSIYEDPLVQRRLVSDLVFGAAPAVGLIEDEKKKAKFWRQNIIGRRLHQWEDLNMQISSYIHFNKETLLWVNAAQKDKGKANSNALIQ